MKTFVINLERRKDRLSKLDLQGLEYEIFKATDGLTLEGYGKLSGHIGCLKSHISLLEKIKSLKVGFALVFEDDVALCDNFVNKFNAILDELPTDFDLLYLGGHNLGEVKKYSKSLNIAENVLTTHAYVVNAKFIDTLLKSLYSREWKVDILFAESLQNGKCFIASHVLAWQREGFSDIVHKVTNNVHLL